MLKPRTYSAGGLELGVTSAIRFPQHKGMKCYAVASGEFWLVVDGIPNAVHLSAGHCLLLPSGRPFRLAGTQERVLEAATNFPAVYCGTISAHNGGGSCLLVGAHYEFTETQAIALLGLLPPIVHLHQEADTAALRWTLQRMTEELRDPQPGGVLIAHYLAKMMLVQALRIYLQESGRDSHGWLSALSDKQMSTAIASMHDEPAHDWTVEELAQRVGMSRSAFSLKFKDTVGESPIEYLTRWRMLVAEDRIDTTSESISEIAQSLGYDSPSAFAKVFKKLTGYPPRERRNRQDTVA